MKTRILLGALVAALLLGTYAFGDWKAKREREKTAEALADVATFTGQLHSARAQAIAAEAAHQTAVKELAEQKMATVHAQWRYQVLLSQVPNVPAVAPDTCGPWVAKIRAMDLAMQGADSVIRSQDKSIATLTDDNTRLAATVTSVRITLDDSSRALATVRKQLIKQTVTPTTGAPTHKLLGLIPLPAVFAGYGALFAADDRRLHTGASVLVGYHIAL